MLLRSSKLEARERISGNELNSKVSIVNHMYCMVQILQKNQFQRYLLQINDIYVRY